jgi:hypothetical protein
MPPLCVKCERPMAYVTTILRVTEPSKVALFQCEHYEIRRERVKSSGRCRSRRVLTVAACRDAAPDVGLDEHAQAGRSD